MSIKRLSYHIHQSSQDFEKVVRACRELLQTSPTAQVVKTYADTRLLPRSQEEFEIGYFPSDQDLIQLVDKVGLVLLKKIGLIYHSYPYNCVQSVFNYHNLVMPYRDDYGNIVALIGRTLLSDAEIKTLQPDINISKYKYTGNFSKSLYLFGLDQAKAEIRAKKTVILVEGQIDCITCHNLGLSNVVALGGSSLSRHQFYLINKFADTIYLLLDNDQAGLKAEKKIKNMYGQYTFIRKLHLPEGYKDIDQYLKNNGPEQLWLKTAN